MSKRYQQRTVGAVVRVPLDPTHHTYAQILPEDYIFFDAFTSEHLDVAEAVTRPTLFRILVMDHAVTTLRWMKAGKAPLRPEFEQPAPMFIQDHYDPTHLQIYLGGVSRPASWSECRGLECCAVWDPGHVEDRLRSHYAGEVDKWTESLWLREVEGVSAGPVPAGRVDGRRPPG